MSPEQRMASSLTQNLLEPSSFLIHLSGLTQRFFPRSPHACWSVCAPAVPVLGTVCLPFILPERAPPPPQYPRGSFPPPFWVSAQMSLTWRHLPPDLSS